MRRIDAIAITVGVFIAGGVAYLLLRVFGLSSQNAGVWSQALLVAGLVGWVSTYLFRVFTQEMTYNKQLQDYEDAVLQKRLEEMTPEELAQLQKEVEAEKAAESSASEKSEDNKPS
ncbi:hypothetical protein PCC7418_1569 [Halothece sp. PCC 7418]|uniref:DUF3007 family protein n=1 Tax=Halothece sp. (strain PCC 7418) TaxID=65093 RepID=UPI0002A07948|nr:DUF3007 family protein [Halothece sp. PCC 7418]AFZ43756.1 hypothetical protein PCC7418_1569 [Halothece sp. PCC 7418]